jgi:hypothetical protein
MSLSYSSLNETFEGSGHMMTFSPTNSLGRDLDINPKLIQTGTTSGSQCPIQQDGFRSDQPPQQQQFQPQFLYHPQATTQITPIPTSIPTSTPKWKSYSNYQKKSDHNYYFQSPQIKFNDIVNDYGKPTLIDVKPKGMAIWNDVQDGLYSRIVIQDEEIYNKWPYPHIGFLYVYTKIDIPYHKVAQVLSISSDITYDIMSKTICIRGMALSYCNALLTLTCKLLSGDLSWYNIKGNNLPKEYLSIKNLTNEAKREENVKYIRKFLYKL